ncbi:MAG TPA: pyrimidine/purine nucleoside phosphorylase [Labilithrix sp.]|jgi:uncharacterized protein YaiE (UPF0345 family)|nr:pyrimidine/purine nucleoside phosphorylase [Labilithrix sp.]
MAESAAKTIENVSVVCKANVYFDGKVVSHTLLSPDGSKRTLGLIFPGTFHFDTAAKERMDIVAGACRVRLAGETSWQTYGGGTAFDVPANSGFDIEVADGMAEYICTFG